MNSKSILISFILLININTNIFAIDHIKNSIVKIFVGSKIITNDKEAYQNNKIRYFWGTGLIVNNKILTSSNLVSDAVWIKVYKYNSLKPYQAKIAKYSNQYGLALLEIANKSFLNSLEAIKLSNSINEQAKISIIAYRAGEDHLSYTHTNVDSIREVKNKMIKKNYPVLQIKEDLGDIINGSVIINMKQEIIAIGIGLDTFSFNTSYAVPSKTIDKFLNDENILKIKEENLFDKKSNIIILGAK
jgi:hypothetical protein